MALLAGRPGIGAYVCPEGIFAVECRRSAGGLQIERTFDVPSRIETASDAADQLLRVLGAAGIDKADVSVALRGFGVVHHVLQLPAAKPELLTPIVEREVRRLEPQLGDATVAWSTLGTSAQAAAADAGSAQLAAAVPRETVQAFEQRLGATRYRLAHVTAVPAAMVRIAEEFDTPDDVLALITSLPDGVFLGFFLGGALRLVVEPPSTPDAPHDAAALAEEAELGAIFVRQQFRGARVDRATVVGRADALDDAESTLGARLGVPVRRLALRDLSSAAHVALGAVLDCHSETPLSLGGASRNREQQRKAGALRSASLAAGMAALLIGTWTVLGAVQARQATRDLSVARLRVQQDSFGLAGLESTARERKLIRDATAALRLAALDRTALQETIANLAFAISPGIRLDSLSMMRTDQGWAVVLGGVAPGTTSAHAVQALHDFYQELPRRVSMKGLSLDRLAYVDSTPGGAMAVRFELSFATPAGKP